MSVSTSDACGAPARGSARTGLCEGGASCMLASSDVIVGRSRGVATCALRFSVRVAALLVNFLGLGPGGVAGARARIDASRPIALLGRPVGDSCESEACASTSSKRGAIWMLPVAHRGEIVRLFSKRHEGCFSMPLLSMRFSRRHRVGWADALFVAPLTPARLNPCDAAQSAGAVWRRV